MTHDKNKDMHRAIPFAGITDAPNGSFAAEEDALFRNPECDSRVVTFRMDPGLARRCRRVLANEERSLESVLQEVLHCWLRQREAVLDATIPSLETKIALLRYISELKEVDVPDDSMLFIAQLVHSNIRELEGLLNRVVVFSALTGRTVSLELTKEALRNDLERRDRRRVFAEITKHVAGYYGLKVEEIKSRSNASRIVFPRQVAMYLFKQLMDLSFQEIGKYFNNKHHSTVMYAVTKIESLRTTDSELNRTVQKMLDQFEFHTLDPSERDAET